MRIVTAFILMSSLLASVSVHAIRDESGPDNGTDYVKVLFRDAHSSLQAAMVGVSDDNLAALKMDAEIKEWLLVKKLPNKSRWLRIKNVLHRIQLRYQAEPCTDFTNRTATICYFNSETGPYVMISLSGNRNTTKSQAAAMLIHEAGHFIGVKDHSFLDRVGLAVVTSLQRKTLLQAHGEVFIKDSTLAGNTPEECEGGTSSVAVKLRRMLTLDIRKQCSQLGTHNCDTENIFFEYSARPVCLDDTVPIEMCRWSLYCKGRALLSVGGL